MRNEKTIRERVIVEVDEAGGVLKIVESLGKDISVQKATTILTKILREDKKAERNRQLELILR